MRNQHLLPCRTTLGPEPRATAPAFERSRLLAGDVKGPTVLSCGHLVTMGVDWTSWESIEVDPRGGGVIRSQAGPAEGWQRQRSQALRQRPQGLCDYWLVPVTSELAGPCSSLAEWDKGLAHPGVGNNDTSCY